MRCSLGTSPYDGRSPNHPASPWTEERDAELRRMWDSGMSAKQIAISLKCGLTRNAVIGRLHRLGLRRGDKPRIERVAKVQAERVRTSKAVIRLPRPARPPILPTEPLPEFRCEPIGPGVALLDLQWRHCRWPVHRDGEPARFCGAERMPGTYAWCAAHRRIGIAPRTTRAAGEAFAGVRAVVKRKRRSAGDVQHVG